MRTIYEPKGAAKEYGDYALNIYTGCPHKCFYCFAPSVLKKDRKAFHENVAVREGVITATEMYLASTKLTGKLIHLCFTCDPYPTGYNTMPTRRIIELLKNSGNNVQILTKGCGSRDFDLLGENDWYGVTLDGTELSENLEETEKFRMRFDALFLAHSKGIKTWVSFEPVVKADAVLKEIRRVAPFIDKVKVGKLNYYPSDIDWKKFGEEAEALCRELHLNYYIKDALRREMEK